MKKHLRLIVVLGLIFLLYSPALFVFFTQDDFFHLGLGQGFNLDSMVKLTKPYHGINYRPVFQLTTWFLYNLFGFRPFFFHAVQLTLHLLTVLVFYLLIKRLFLKKQLALLAAFFYGLSPCFFMAIFWWGAAHVLLMVFFSLFAFYLLFDHPWISSLVFLLALFSNELAVVFPFIVFLILFQKKKTKLACFLFVPLLVYLLARFVFSPPSFTHEYRITTNTISWLQNLRWYLLRILGLPEGIRILLQRDDIFLLTRLNIFLTAILGIIFTWLLYLLLRKLHFKKDFAFFWGVCWFFLGILIALPLTLHQSSFYLAVSLMGFSLCCSFLVNGFIRKSFGKILTTVLYIILSFISLGLSRETHWVTRRANLTRKNLNQVIQKLERLNHNEVVVFLNGDQVKATEVYLSMSGPDALRVYYKNPELKVLFEGYDNLPEKKEGVYFFKARD